MNESTLVKLSKWLVWNIYLLNIISCNKQYKYCFCHILMLFIFLLVFSRVYELNEQYAHALSDRQGAPRCNK